MPDLRSAWRSLRSTPLLVALGIGANTAIFSILNSLMLRPLPVANADRLTVLAASDDPVPVFSYPVWQQSRADAVLVDGAASWGTARLTLSPSCSAGWRSEQSSR
jgi:hypothetical protein